VQQRLRERVEDTQYRLWFASLRVLARTDAVLSLAVPTRFTGAWLRDHYGDQITDVVHEVMGRRYEVQFVVPEASGG
jgi:chromosomal replication initiation ATPase DnaA